MKYLFAIACAAFVLHFAWESAHVGLYTAYDHLTTMPITLYATLGDVVYVLLAVLIVALAKRSLAWMREPHVFEYGALAAIGALIALMVEYKGLYFARWEYLPAMPIVPIANVGASPLIQMTLLVPLSVFVVAVFYRYKRIRD